jgi:RimJ/RimL family protein N-acetyltransferase
MESYQLEKRAKRKKNKLFSAHFNRFPDFPFPRWLEIGIVIYSPEHWNGGLGTEALSLWIDYLFENLTIERVGLTTWSGNPRMMRCAEKLGMRLEGRMRKCRYYNGEYYDSIRMGILREKWDEFKKNNPLFN